MVKERIARQNTNWTIIDGGVIPEEDLGSLPPPRSIKPFIDGVMERIENEAPIQLSEDQETVLEYCGPKRLPKIVTRERVEIQKQEKHSILDFFRRK